MLKTVHSSIHLKLRLLLHLIRFGPSLNLEQLYLINPIHQLAIFSAETHPIYVLMHLLHYQQLLKICHYLVLSIILLLVTVIQIILISHSHSQIAQRLTWLLASIRILLLLLLPADQKCSFCHRTGAHLPTYCPLIDQAIASRNSQAMQQSSPSSHHRLNDAVYFRGHDTVEHTQDYENILNDFEEY